MHQLTKLKIFYNIHPRPVIVIDSAIKKAYFLPFVSEIKFMTMRPVNEPIGKQAWMIVLAHSISQKRPMEEVIVKPSTEKVIEKSYLACILRCPYKHQFTWRYHLPCHCNETTVPCTKKVNSRRRTSWRSRRWPTNPTTVSGTCVSCLLTIKLIWVWFWT